MSGLGCDISLRIPKKGLVICQSNKGFETYLDVGESYKAKYLFFDRGVHEMILAVELSKNLTGQFPARLFESS